MNMKHLTIQRELTREELQATLCEHVNTFGYDPVEYLKDRCRNYSLELKVKTGAST